jgi:virulence-associated protein VagC
MRPRRNRHTLTLCADLRRECTAQDKAEILIDNCRETIRTERDELVLSERPKDWCLYLATGPIASQKFMEDVDDLPIQECEP